MNVGLIRLAVLRSTPVFALINICMIAYLFVESAGWAHWYFGVIGLVGLWIWIDMKFIWKAEINETFGRSKDISELLRLSRNIKKSMKVKSDVNNETRDFFPKQTKKEDVTEDDLKWANSVIVKYEKRIGEK